ncbi:MAG TPA: hypothetical protein VD970_02070, partial [Acetobacteraceae bacterium]|nr:hypothetical protein [Acetobacteraceae bacterium]
MSSTPPGVTAWGDALQRVSLTDDARAWLRAHLTAPGCRATEPELEIATGRPIAEYRALAAAIGAGLRQDSGPHPNPPPLRRGGGASLPCAAGEGWGGGASLGDPLLLIATRDPSGAYTLRPDFAFALGLRRVLPEDWDRGSRERSTLSAPPGESPIVVLV